MHPVLLPRRAAVAPLSRPMSCAICAAMPKSGSAASPLEDSCEYSYTDAGAVGSTAGARPEASPFLSASDLLAPS
eukprot:7407202-Pyramimonas_sp.AAC.1